MSSSSRSASSDNSSNESENSAGGFSSASGSGDLNSNSSGSNNSNSNSSSSNSSSSRSPSASNSSSSSSSDNSGNQSDEPIQPPMNAQNLPSMIPSQAPIIDLPNVPLQRNTQLPSSEQIFQQTPVQIPRHSVNLIPNTPKTTSQNDNIFLPANSTPPEEKHINTQDALISTGSIDRAGINTPIPDQNLINTPIGQANPLPSPYNLPSADNANEQEEFIDNQNGLSDYDSVSSSQYSTQSQSESSQSDSERSDSEGDQAVPFVPAQNLPWKKDDAPYVPKQRNVFNDQSSSTADDNTASVSYNEDSQNVVSSETSLSITNDQTQEYESEKFDVSFYESLIQKIDAPTRRMEQISLRRLREMQEDEYDSLDGYNGFLIPMTEADHEKYKELQSESADNSKHNPPPQSNLKPSHPQCQENREESPTKPETYSVSVTTEESQSNSTGNHHEKRESLNRKISKPELPIIPHKNDNMPPRKPFLYITNNPIFEFDIEIGDTKDIEEKTFAEFRNNDWDAYVIQIAKST